MKPVFQNLQRTRQNTIAFQLAPTHVAYANTLRRLCMTAVETVGFRADMTDKGTTTDVRIKANSTPMTNEMLAHRIGLLPVFAQNPTSWDPEQYKFTLDVTNTSKDFRDVTAADFRVQEKKGDDFVDIPSSRFFAADPITGETALLAVLKPMMPGGKPEEIQLEARATVGVGRENARFIPTSQCSYAYTLNKEPAALKKVFDDWLVRAKKLNPSAIEQDAEKKAVLEREFKTLEINRCYLKDQNGEPYSFDFTVESVGVLTPEYIVARALENGARLCERFVEEALPEDVTVQYADSKLFGYDFFFQHQDHTLGHLIQAWLDQNLVGNGEITFAGYDVPHPLRDEMVIRIGVAGREVQEKVARAALRNAMTACAGMFRGWRQEWSALAAGPQAPSVPGGPGKTLQVKKRAIQKPTAASKK
jgi:DNA-directed RNA polymerase subunit D